MIADYSTGPFSTFNREVASFTLGACGSDSTTSAADTSPGATEWKIAFLSPSVANTYVAQTWSAMEEIAEKRGASLTQFDAALDVARQQEQLQNVVASGEYDGVIISALSDAVSADVTAAAAAGLKVVVVGSVLGTRLDTPDPQVEGVGLSVVAPQTEWGEGLGVLTKQACEGEDPCRVVYLWGVKGLPQDEARFGSFKETIADEPTIQLVAEAESQYATDVALTAMQNVLQSTPDFDVVVGTDQAISGAQIALEQAGKLADVALIGVGGSKTAIAEVAAGHWFGGLMTVPRTEGALAIDGMFELLEDGALSTPAGINPLQEMPDGGLFTQENLDELEPQWEG
jgi:ribose transport system substrate-binding protein